MDGIDPRAQCLVTFIKVGLADGGETGGRAGSEVKGEAGVVRNGRQSSVRIELPVE